MFPKFSVKNFTHPPDQEDRDHRGASDFRSVPPCFRSVPKKTSCYTKLTPFVARGPCASQGSLDQKTSNQDKWV